MGATYSQRIVDAGWDMEQLVQVFKGHEARVDELLRSLGMRATHRKKFLDFISIQKAWLSLFHSRPLCTHLFL